MNSNKFLIKTGVATITLLALEYTADSMDWFAVPAAMYIMTLVFAMVSWLTYRYLSKVNIKNPKKFINAFMGALAIKMFASIIFITIYLFFSEPEYKVPMAIGLFIVYMTSNILILTQITPEIRNQKSGNTTQ